MLFFNFPSTNCYRALFRFWYVGCVSSGIKLRGKKTICSLMFTSDQNRCGRVRLYGPFRLTSSIADCIEIKSMCISSTHRNEFLMPNVYLFMLVCWWSSGVHTILMEQIKYAKHILWMTVSCGMYAIRDLMIFGLPHLFSSSSFFARIFIIYQPFLTMMMVSFLSLYFFFSWSIFLHNHYSRKEHAPHSLGVGFARLRWLSRIE